MIHWFEALESLHAIEEVKNKNKYSDTLSTHAAQNTVNETIKKYCMATLMKLLFSR